MMRRSFGGRTGWPAECALALLVALLALVLHAYAGFPTLAASHGDNDSLLRLVEIRDLLGGQRWFDLHQYRMGPSGGFVMHWSRFVDAPIAAIMIVAAAVTGSTASGETVALVVWPLLLMATALAFMLRLARALGGEWALLPALTIGGAALHFVGIFAPGNIDHHNVQLVLTLAALTALVVGRGFVAGALAAAACALMLAIGMETLPYVAVAGLVVSLAFLRSGGRAATKTAGFGAGFAGAGAAAFIATVAPDAWLAPHCDAYSIPQFTVALVAGTGLAAITVIPGLSSTFARRSAALVALGILVVGIVRLFFPECLADPYSGLDPRLQKFWLSAITEAQPISSILANNLAMAAGYYVTPLIGLGVLVLSLRRDRPNVAGWVIAAFLVMAFAVSLWQVRGAMFSIPLAVVPLSAWVGERRREAASDPAGRGRTIRMALSWLISLNVAWSSAANAAARMLGAPVSPAAASFAGTCDRTEDYAALAAEPVTTVLAVSNIGVPILVNTHHRVFAGPYHRNIAGNLLALDALMGADAEARTIVHDHAVGLVAVCPGNDETAALVEWAPQGLLATLVAGNVPAWLERLPQEHGTALQVYRVRRAQ